MSRVKSEAQKFMESFKLNATKVECKLAEWQFWNDLSLSITGQMGGERVQTSGAKDKMAEARDKCMDKESEILDSVNNLVETQTEVTGVLDQMENPAEYKLLHLRYLQFKEFDEIADIFKVSYDATTTAHGRALKSLEKILSE